jgi:lipopolysaccharide biosynthesis glycosyltransferase
MINIVFGFDDKFAKFCATAIASILSNHKIEEQDDIICFFLPDNINAKNKRRILDLRKIQDFKYEFYKVDMQALKDLPIGVWSIATYYKLLIPDIVSVDKIIALDCDIILKDDIKKLWDFDISNYLAAAVKVSVGAVEGTYYNAGIMVLNIKKLKEFNFADKWRQYIKTRPQLICVDQDILNHILDGGGGKVLFLPIEYNVVNHHYDYMVEHNMTDKIVILHYTPGKPLEFDCLPSLRKLWFAYCAMTYWKENMRDFWIRRFIVNPIFFLKPKYWKKIKEMRQKERNGE